MQIRQTKNCSSAIPQSSRSCITSLLRGFLEQSMSTGTTRILDNFVHRGWQTRWDAGGLARVKREPLLNRERWSRKQRVPEGWKSVRGEKKIESSERETKRKRGGGGGGKVISWLSWQRKRVSGERSIFGRASSIYRRCPFLSLAWAFSPTCPALFHPLLPVAVVSEEEGGWGLPARVLSILCIAEQLRPTPRLRAICEYMRFPLPLPPAPLPPPRPIHRFSRSSSRSISIFLLFLFPSLPVTAARTSFCAPWGCKCIRDDGRVLPEWLMNCNGVPSAL